jgi:hypothetical protein
MWDLCELPDFEDSKKPPEIVRFLEETLSRKFTEPLAPALTLTMSEQSTLKIFSGELEKAASESMVSFIKGSMDIEKDWPVYIALLEKKGWKEIEEIWNAAWKRQGGAHKKP